MKQFQADSTWYVNSILDDMNDKRFSIGTIQMNIAALVNQLTWIEAEKRRYHRLSLHLPMEYSLEESPRFRLAHTVDICEGGLSIHVPEKLRIGQNMIIKFYYPSPSGLDYGEALAEIIRVERLDRSGKEYRCALQFLDSSSDLLKKFQGFLKSLY
jgi:c-di-GMP-binding flagellar brake protein YcgR